MRGQDSVISEAHIQLSGRVQGVMLRKTIASYAVAQSLAGYVRNNNDASVSVCAQGTKVQLSSLVNWLQQSPGLSHITGMNIEFRPVTGYCDGFTIQRHDGLIKDQIRSMQRLGHALAGKDKMPVHVAIIPDGNRRWAAKRGLAKTAGHAVSTEQTRVRALLQTAKDLEIKYLTIWGFSTENWNRSAEERAEIFRIVDVVLSELSADAAKNRIRFQCFGRRDRLPKKVLDSVASLEQQTAAYSGMQFSLCLDYGGRDELLRSFNDAIRQGLTSVDEKNFAKYLDTRNLPDPDLIIRTGGEQRLSGFMPWQSIYAELYFTDAFFPDFGPEQLREAVAEYSRRNRRFGGDGK